MARPRLEDIVFAKFGTFDYLVGYREHPPLLHIKNNSEFNIYEKEEKKVGSWTVQTLSRAIERNTKLKPWLLKHWNNIDFSKGFQEISMMET